MKIQTTIDIPDEVILDVLVTALEGGSNYWYEFREEASDIIAKYTQEGKCFVDWLWDAIKNDESIPVHDIESGEDDTPLGYLHLLNIKWGTEKMGKDGCDEFALLIAKEPDIDANVADVIFQYWVLGEIIYS